MSVRGTQPVLISILLILPSALTFAEEPAPLASPAISPTPAASPVAAGPVWTLSDVKKMALEQNPDLRSARASYDAASARIGQSVSAYLPHASVEAKFEQTTLPSPSAGSTALLGIASPYTAGIVSVRQTLFDFGQGLSRIQSSVAGSHSAEQQELAVRAEVELGVQKAFYGVIAAQRLVEVAQKNLAQNQETLRRTEVLVSTGARPSFDLSQAKVEVSKARLGLIRAQNDRVLAKVLLLNLIGAPKQMEFSLKEEADAESVTSDKLDLEKLTGKALAARPEIKREEFAADSVKDLKRAEIQTYLPTLDLRGWYGRYEPDYPVSLRDAWGVGVGATWHFFDGLSTTFRVKELSAQAVRQEAALDKQRLDVSSQVAAGFAGLTTSESNQKVAEEALDAAKENMRLAQKRYEANVGTILELLVAQTSLVNAEAVEVQSHYEHAIALATLRRAVNAPLIGE